MCDPTGTSDNFRIAMRAIETPKKILTSEVCFLSVARQKFPLKQAIYFMAGMIGQNIGMS